MPVGGAAGRAVDLAGIAEVEEGLGVVWTQEGSADLNANLVRFEAGEGVEIRANGEVDVVFVGVSGSGTVTVNGEEFALEPGRMVLASKGCLRLPGAVPASSLTSRSTGGGGPCASPRRPPGGSIDGRGTTGRRTSA